jgi:hypothetical protein
LCKSSAGEATTFSVLRPGAYAEGAGFSSVFGVSGTGYLGGYGF